MQIVVQEDQNKRVDRVVTDTLVSEGFALTRNIVQDNISKFVTVNNLSAKKSYKLKVNDKLDIDLDSFKRLEEGMDLSKEIQSQEGDLDIRYEDNDLLVIYKPKGLVVHPGVGNSEGTLANYLKYYLESKGNYDNLLDRSGIVHRLDKGVSGLMVVAKNKRTQDYLKEQFTNHHVTKIYRARVEEFKNNPDLELCVPDISIQKYLRNLNIEEMDLSKWVGIEGYIGRSSRNRYKMEFKKYEFGGSKYAKSYILPFGEEMLIKIETGRMHQIRATLEYMGFHIVGDSLYGVNKKTYESSDIQLESVVLSFVDQNGKRICIKNL